MYIKPLSLSRDKQGSEAKVCDVIFNTNLYYKRVENDELHKTFLVTVSLEAIEDKYKPIELKLDKNNWIILKNKIYQEPDKDDHRSKPPLIVDITSQVNELKMNTRQIKPKRY